MRFIKAILAVVFICWTGSFAKVPIHSGDIKLEVTDRSPDGDTVTGVLLVNFGSNKDVPALGTVCSERFNEENQGSESICNILGYTSGEFLGGSGDGKLVSEPLQANYSILLTELDCSPDKRGVKPNHLLRCLYKPFDKANSCLQGVVHLKCSGQKGIPLNQYSNSYRGQVQLCPPNELHNDPSYPAIQPSFGLVSVFHHNVWGSVNYDTPLSLLSLGSFDADSICLQLGFTQAVAGSLRTVESFRGEYNFSDCYHMRSGSTLNKIWLTADKTDQCSSNPTPCFSCCYNRPGENDECPQGDCVDGKCPEGTCSRVNDLVISCIFDGSSTVVPPSGNKGDCRFEPEDTSLSYRSVCAQPNGNTYTLKEILPAGLIPSFLALVSLIFGFVLLILYCRHRRRGYGELEAQGDNGERNDNGNEGHQNGGGANQNGGGGANQNGREN